MNALIIETSTEKGIIALSSEGKVIAFIELPTGLNSSSHLMPSIEKLPPLKLDYIVLGVGPGSYTGIRVAASVAKSIAYALKIPIVPLNSLIAFIPQYDGPYTVLVDAKISGAYTLSATFKNNEICSPTKPMVKAIEELNLESTLVTPQKKRLKEKIESNHRWIETYPSPSHLSKMGYQKFLNDELVAARDVELLYLRAPVV